MLEHKICVDIMYNHQVLVSHNHSEIVAEFHSLVTATLGSNIWWAKILKCIHFQVGQESVCVGGWWGRSCLSIIEYNIMIMGNSFFSDSHIWCQCSICWTKQCCLKQRLVSGVTLKQMVEFCRTRDVQKWNCWGQLKMVCFFI